MQRATVDALSSIFFSSSSGRPFGLNIRVNNLILNPHKYGRRKVNANTNYSDIFWTLSNCIYRYYNCMSFIHRYTAGIHISDDLNTLILKGMRTLKNILTLITLS